MIHYAHQGIEKFKLREKGYVSWIKMNKDIYPSIIEYLWSVPKVSKFPAERATLTAWSTAATMTHYMYSNGLVYVGTKTLSDYGWFV